MGTKDQKNGSELFADLMDAIMWKSEKDKESQKNIDAFSKKVGELAEKHKVFFIIQAFDKDSSVTNNSLDTDSAVKFGFKDEHAFAHVLEMNTEELAKNAYNLAVVAWSLLHKNCKAYKKDADTEDEGSDAAEVATEVPLSKAKPVYDKDGKQIGDYIPHE